MDSKNLTRREFVAGMAALTVIPVLPTLPTFTADQPPVSDTQPASDFADEFYRACIEASVEIGILGVAVKQFQRGEIGRDKYMATLRRADKFNLIWVIAKVAGVEVGEYQDKTWNL